MKNKPNPELIDDENPDKQTPIRQLAINKIHNKSTKNRTLMTLIVMIDADFSWIIRVYHNYLRHLRSIVFVVYFLRVTLTLIQIR